MQLIDYGTDYAIPAQTCRWLWETAPSAHDRCRVGIPNTGRLFELSANLVRQAFGVDVSMTRELLHPLAPDLDLVCARSSDLPALLERGFVDAAITGEDYVREAGGHCARAAELGLCPGRICVLAPTGSIALSMRSPVRVVSQYPRLASEWCASRSLGASVLAVSGAAELYPRLGLADVIIDNVTTGRTAADNGLEIVTEIMTTAGSLFTAECLEPAAREPIERFTAAVTEAARAGAR